MRIMKADLDLLARVGDGSKEGDVTWRDPGPRRRTFRLWSSEYDYEIVTQRAQRLLNAGLIELRHGYKFSVGYVVLTPSGRAALKDAGQYSGAL